MTAAAAVSVPMVEIAEQKRGVGVLELLGPAGRVALPLAGVEIKAKVSSFVAEVTVRQTFKNPHTEHLEAEYVFPLAGGCAVGRFELHVAGRVVIGKVEERGEARRQYAEAIAQGKRAALLEQERSNVFTVKVGNLPPGEEATVLLTYSERLAFFEDGAAELRLPLVVAPRYIAGAPLDEENKRPAGSGTESDTNRVPDASRLTPPRLAEGFDPRVGLKIDVELLGEGFAELCSSQHATRTSMSGGTIGVSLAKAERLDRDFVLRWRLGGPEITSALQTFKAKGGERYGMLTLVPPRREGFLGLPREVVFVVDRSGSMGGVKMTSAARACALLLRTLGPRDRFAVQAFDDRVEWLEDGKRRFFAADEAGLEKGEAFLRGIVARGGTELDGAMREAIAAFAAKGEAKDKTERLPIVVLLTDGQVGDESSVLKRLQTSLGEVRVFTVGIDTAVNDGFLRKLAAVGGGTATMVEPGTALEEALRSVGREIGAPLVTGLALADDGSGLDEDSLAPSAMPDLFEGRAATVFVKLKKAGALKLTGTFVDGKKFKASVKAHELELPALGQLWARTRVGDLEDRFRLASAGMPAGKGDTAELLKAEIVRLACAHTLLTRFTAFVAVDQEVVNKGGEQRKIVQPVEQPAGWEEQAAPRMAMRAMAMPAMAQAPMQAANSVAADSFDDLAESGPPPSVAFAKASHAAGAPPPSSPAPMGRARGGMGIMKKMAGVFRGGAGIGKDERAREERATAPDPAEMAAVLAALEAFAAALSLVKGQLAAGEVADADQLEAARKKLLAALGTFGGASRLPLLQRFLRTAAAELGAALRSTSSAKALAKLADKAATSFVAAEAEAKSALAGKAAKAPWEASI